MGHEAERAHFEYQILIGRLCDYLVELRDSLETRHGLGTVGNVAERMAAASWAVLMASIEANKKGFS